MNSYEEMPFHKRLYWAALIYLMGKQHCGEPTKKMKKRNALNGHYIPLDGGDTIEITSESTPKEIRHLKWLMLKNTVKIRWFDVCRHVSDVTNVFKNAKRYRKLRDLMTRNVQPTWEQTERIAAVGAWVDWDAFDDYLDATDVEYLHRQSRP